MLSFFVHLKTVVVPVAIPKDKYRFNFPFTTDVVSYADPISLIQLYSRLFSP